MRCLPVLFMLATLVPLAPAAGQDLLLVAPALARVEHEDARVRVVRLHIPEQASIAMHDRPVRVVVSLTPNHVRLTRPDGLARVTHTTAGTVAWSEPAVRSVANLGGAVENIVVELKQVAGAARPVLEPPAVTSDGHASEPQPRWTFANQYVRVYGLRIAPGETATLPAAAYDQVAVQVSGGRVSVEQEGQPRRPPEPVAPHGVSFSARSAAPLAHRVRNDGDTEYHVILVQFLD